MKAYEKGNKKILFVTLLALACVLLAGQAEKVHTVKAAYVYNFMKFTNWPSNSSFHSSSTLNFCIIGKNDFSKYLKLVAKKKIGKKKIKIINDRSTKNVKDCHAVFIGNGLRDDVTKISQEYAKMGILTMSELPKFPYEKGIIGFYNDNGKIKFAVNVKNASEAGFKISSKLLELAKVIR